MYWINKRIINNKWTNLNGLFWSEREMESNESSIVSRRVALKLLCNRFVGTLLPLSCLCLAENLIALGCGPCVQEKKKKQLYKTIPVLYKPRI